LLIFIVNHAVDELFSDISQTIGNMNHEPHNDSKSCCESRTDSIALSVFRVKVKVDKTFVTDAMLN